MRLTMLHLAVAGAVALTACSDVTDPGNASEADRAEIVAALDASGWFEETFGEEGDVENASLSVTGFDLNLSASASAMDTVPLTQRWGRRFHRPTERSREIVVTGDTAVATWTVRFGDGEFLLDRTRDDTRNATSKPMDVSVIMSATLVRRAETDSAGRRWQLIALSPHRLVPSDEDKRTVVLNEVTVSVNGEVVKTITDVNRRNDAQGVLALEIGDEVVVTASVTNTTGHDNVPETFVFLHLYHARAGARGWMRLPMRANDDGTWSLMWTVRHNGRQRMSVDALDSQVFNTDDGDDYRGEAWGVPYRIR